MQLTARFPREQMVQWVRQSWQALSKPAGGCRAMLDGICVRSIPTAAMGPCKGDMSPVSPAGDQPLSHLSWVENERPQMAPAPGMTSSAVFCSFALFIGFQLLTSEGHCGRREGVLDSLSPGPTVTHTGSSLMTVGLGWLSPAISHHIRGSGES